MKCMGPKLAPSTGNSNSVFGGIFKFPLSSVVLQAGWADCALQARGRGLHLLAEHDQLLHEQGEQKMIDLLHVYQYKAGRPICRRVLKIMFWEVPPADWLIL